jgi:hypothetical protein
MTRSNREISLPILAFAALLALTAASPAPERPPICERIAKSYGLDSFPQIEQLRYTFNIDAGPLQASRTWVWEPKTDRVSYEGKDKEGKPVKVAYLRSQLGSQPANVKEEVDPAFINDKYWLLFPLQLFWDASAKVEDKGPAKRPLGEGSAKHVVVTYPSAGGYTPGDAYELFVGDDDRIQEWIFHRGGSPDPTLTASWAEHEKAGPLVVSLDHRGTFQGKPARIFFSDVAVKLKGSNDWVSAQ